MRKKIKRLLWAAAAAVLILQGTVLETEAAGTVAVDETNFPCSLFRRYVSDHFDGDGDGSLSETELAAVTDINIGYGEYAGVSSVQGIEYFPNLKTLHCGDSYLTLLDVSQNPLLEELSAAEGGLTQLDVSGNLQLRELICNGNQLTVLDVTQNTKLQVLEVRGNVLTELNVNSNPELQQLDCGENQLKALYVGFNPKLYRLGCDQNQLTALRVAQNTGLEYLFAEGNVREVLMDQDRVVDLSQLDGFYSSFVISWQGGTESGGDLLVEENAQTVTYLYDCGNGYQAEFTLVPVLQLPGPQLQLRNAAATGKPVLQWDGIEGAVGYQLYRAEKKAGPYSKIADTVECSISDLDTTAGTRYYYKVRAVDGKGFVSAFSQVQSRLCDLPQPTGIQVGNDAATGKNKISWDAAEGAQKYQVWYSTTGKTGSFKILMVTKNLSHIHKGAEAGKLYYYKVCAAHTNSYANSALTGAYKRTCDLARPTGLTISSDAVTGKNVIRWNGVAGADKYQVWYSETGENNSFKLLMTTRNLTHTHKNGTAGTRYYYKVRAVHSNTSANSALTGWLSRICDLARPVVTIGNNASTGKVRLTWEAVAGAEKYQVWFSETGKTGTFKLTWTCKNLYFNHNGSKVGVTGYYKVKAIHSNAKANSAFSAVVTGGAV